MRERVSRERKSEKHHDRETQTVKEREIMRETEIQRQTHREGKKE